MPDCKLRVVWPRWSRDVNVQRGIEAFADKMIDRGWAENTARRYAEHVARGWADPMRYLASLTSWQGQQHAKAALCAYADHVQQPEAKGPIKGAPEPLRPPRRPVHVPTLDVWRRLGPDLLRRHPLELGHVLWVLFYSGLRIGDVCGLTRAQVAAAGDGRTVEMRQKGRGGHRKRTFRCLDVVRFALTWLARRPGWGELWQSVSSSVIGAKQAIRTAIPDPYDPHDFRRAFATYLYYNGADLLTIAQMGGWESVQSVERYIVFVPEERIEFHRRNLSNLLFPRQNTTRKPTPQPCRPMH